MEEFNDWTSHCHDLVHRATKAANWFADNVRASVNPLFFATHGKFVVTEGPFEDLMVRSTMPEFTAEEKASQPEDIKQEIMRWNERKK